MNPEDVARILDELGERLGPAGEYVFQLAVRQVYINALTSVVALVLVLALTAVVVPRAERWRRDDTGSYGDRGFVMAFAYGGWACVVGFVVLWVFFAVPSIFNAEYAAIRSILTAIGGAS